MEHNRGHTDYKISPYSKESFDNMPDDVKYKAYAHFICLLSLTLSKICDIDFEKINKSNFTNEEINKLEWLNLIECHNSCLKYIESLNKAINKTAHEKLPSIKSTVNKV